MISLQSCKKEATAPESETPQEEVNPNKPNANQLILSQKISGDSTKGSTIYEIIDAVDGGFFFTGRMNSYNVVGKLNQLGNELWTRRTVYWARDIFRIPENTGQITNALLTVGGFDSNVDGDVDEGKVLLCNGTDGAVMGELTLHSTDHDVWLNTVAISSKSVDSCQFVGFGAAKVLGIYYPWAVRFSIMSNGTIMKREESTFSSLPWISFSAAVEDLTLLPQSYFVKGERYLNDSIVTNVVVLGLSDTLGVLWSQDIVHRPGFRTETYTGDGIILSDGNIIVVGRTEIEKEKNPSSGYWDAGLVASIGKLGQVNWIKAFTLTAYDEDYVDCFVIGNAVWITGVTSDFLYIQSKRTFGYGLLSKIDVTTGGILSNMSFGNDKYKSGFNSVVVSGNRSYCVGRTNCRVSGEGYQSWFAEIDISNPLPASQKPIVSEKVGTVRSSNFTKDKSIKER